MTLDLLSTIPDHLCGRLVSLALRTDSASSELLAMVLGRCGRLRVLALHPYYDETTKPIWKDDGQHIHAVHHLRSLALDGVWLSACCEALNFLPGLERLSLSPYERVNVHANAPSLPKLRFISLAPVAQDTAYRGIVRSVSKTLQYVTVTETKTLSGLSNVSDDLISNLLGLTVWSIHESMDSSSSESDTQSSNANSSPRDLQRHWANCTATLVSFAGSLRSLQCIFLGRVLLTSLSDILGAISTPLRAVGLYSNDDVGDGNSEAVATLMAEKDVPSLRALRILAVSPVQLHPVFVRRRLRVIELWEWSEVVQWLVGGEAVPE